MFHFNDFFVLRLGDGVWINFGSVVLCRKRNGEFGCLGTKKINHTNMEQIIDGNDEKDEPLLPKFLVRRRFQIRTDQETTAVLLHPYRRFPLLVVCQLLDRLQKRRSVMDNNFITRVYYSNSM